MNNEVKGRMKLPAMNTKMTCVALVASLLGCLSAGAEE